MGIIGVLRLTARLVMILCYGENRRQAQAALYALDPDDDDPLAIHRFEQLSGNPLSYINVTDVDRVLTTACRLAAGWNLNFGTVPRIAIGVKHGNACGAAAGEDELTVITKMVEGDHEAIFGGVVLVNFILDGAAARALRTTMMTSGKRGLDVVIAPGFTEEAMTELERKTGKCRLLQNPALATRLHELDTSPRFRQVRRGVVTQEGDPFVLEIPKEWGLVDDEPQNIVLGWAVGSTSNSNTITLTKNGMLIGNGTGQRSRVMAAKLALNYATTYGHSTNGAVAYSDSFFPFPDGPEVLADAGVKLIFATTGSEKDALVAATCKNREVKLVTLPDSVARGFFAH